jgi:hypothetical protein
LTLTGGELRALVAADTVDGKSEIADVTDKGCYQRHRPRRGESQAGKPLPVVGFPENSD